MSPSNNNRIGSNNEYSAMNQNIMSFFQSFVNGRRSVFKFVVLMAITSFPIALHQYTEILEQYSNRFGYLQTRSDEANASSASIRANNSQLESSQSRMSLPARNSRNKSDSNTICFSWNESKVADAWWSLNPTYIASSQDLETGVCFSPLPPSAKSYFFQQVWDNQYLNTTNSKNGSMENDESNRCSKVHTRHMWSSGWGADFTNVAHGLMYGLENQVPFQVTFQYEDEKWHYAAFKEEYRDGRPPVCPSADMFCYFLPLSPCAPCSIEELNTDPPLPEAAGHALQFWDGQYNAWLVEYANRPQMWLRRKVLQYMKDRAPYPIEKPCAVIHVRRTDVILHGEYSRKYFAIEDYLNTLKNAGGKHRNILLFTDDANAVEEALELHPSYHWMVIDKPRHKGSSGGWENQVPSDDPSEEVAAILTEMKLAQECDTLVYGASGYAKLIWNSMVNGGERVVSLRVDNGKKVESKKNEGSEELLNKRLEISRRMNVSDHEDEDIHTNSSNFKRSRKRGRRINENVKRLKAEKISNS